jgi:hypothetical protein
MAGGRGPLDLELLKEILRDKRLHIVVALVKRLEMATDRSTLRVIASVFPEQREIVARMTWEFVGPSSGVYQLPVPDDLVLLGLAEGDDDQAFVIRKLSSKVDKIPQEADSGDLILKALSGKATRAISDTAVYLARPDSIPTQPLVLGTVFQTMMSAVLDYISVHTHIGNLGYKTTVPDNASNFLAQKSSPVDNGNILSDLAKTEK